MATAARAMRIASGAATVAAGWGIRVGATAAAAAGRPGRGAVKGMERESGAGMAGDWWLGGGMHSPAPAPASGLTWRLQNITADDNSHTQRQARGKKKFPSKTRTSIPGRMHDCVTGRHRCWDRGGRRSPPGVLLCHHPDRPGVPDHKRTPVPRGGPAVMTTESPKAVTRRPRRRRNADAAVGKGRGSATGGEVCELIPKKVTGVDIPARLPSAI